MTTAAAKHLAAFLCLHALVGCAAPRASATVVDASPPPAPPPPAASTASPSAPAAAPVAPPAPPPAAAPAPQRSTLEIERTIDVGKWPEGVVVVGDDAWVAESGARRVSRVALTGNAAPAHVSVGRLPVQIVAAPSGKLYALAQTDKTVWEIDPKTTRGRVFATVADCPESMALGEGVLWVLLWQKCSSVDSSIVRVDLATKKQATSPATGRNAWGLAPSGGRVWVTLGDGTNVSVDGATLQDLRRHGAVHGPGTLTVIGAGANAVFTSSGPTLQRTDASTGAVTHEVAFTSRVDAISFTGDEVVAVDDAGHLKVLDPATLAVRHEMTPTSTIAQPHAVARWRDGRYVLTTAGPDGASGQLLIVRAKPSSGANAP